MVVGLEQGADLHVAQLMPLAYLGRPGKGPLNRCVCVCDAVNDMTVKALGVFWVLGGFEHP